MSLMLIPAGSFQRPIRPFFKLLCGFALLLSLLSCQLSPTTPSLSPSSLQAVPNQVIVEYKDARFLKLAKQRLGAQVLDTLTVDGHHYTLLELDPQQIAKQPYAELSQYAGLSPLEAAAHDLWRNHAEMLESLDLNPVAEPPQPAEAPLFNDLGFGSDSALSGWWRQQTGVEKAWQISIGTGVKASYIDVGFVRQHPELEQRLLLSEQSNQTVAGHEDASNIEVPQGDHGTASLLVGFAERDNHLPAVGVAPATFVAPYVASSVWEAARALSEASRIQPDVIGMNLSFQLFPDWQRFGEYRQYVLLKAVIADLARNPRLSLVIPAHNYAEPITGGVREWAPVGWAQEYSNIIPVGGVQINGDQKVSAWFNPGLLTGINGRGSNYGERMIWAPSTFLDTASTDPDGLLPNQMNGTSASCPFVTASVALIKSRFPEMLAADLRQLLLDSAEAVDGAALLQQPQARVPFIQVDRALKLAIQRSGQDPSRYQPRTFRGRLRLSHTGYQLETEVGESWPVIANQVSLIQKAMRQDPIEILGWQGLNKGQPTAIEPLHWRYVENP